MSLTETKACPAFAEDGFRRGGGQVCVVNDPGAPLAVC